MQFASHRRVPLYFTDCALSHGKLGHGCILGSFVGFGQHGAAGPWQINSLRGMTFRLHLAPGERALIVNCSPFAPCYLECHGRDTLIRFKRKKGADFAAPKARESPGEIAESLDRHHLMARFGVA